MIDSLLHYWPQRSCGQGNIFTPVCHSFCSQGGICLSACWDTSPQQTPPRPDTTPRPDTPPGTRPPPSSRQPPGADPLPGKQTPAYGLRAAGTHPTGMHSFFMLNLTIKFYNPIDISVVHTIYIFAKMPFGALVNQKFCPGNIITDCTLFCCVFIWNFYVYSTTKLPFDRLV